jgi:hypothetical protein
MGETRTVVRRRIGRRIASGDVGRKLSSTEHRGAKCQVQSNKLCARAADARSMGTEVRHLYLVLYTLYFFDDQS